MILKELITRQLPTAFCHASNIIALPNKEFLCCWFGGSFEGASDVAIYASRRTTCGWGKPVKLTNGKEAAWNPVLFLGKDGILKLFYKEGQYISQWRTMLLNSIDCGYTWSVPRELVPGDNSGGRGPVRNKILKLKSGRLVAGASTEHVNWTAFADLSDDGGNNWYKSQIITIQSLSCSLAKKITENNIPVSKQSFNGRGIIQPSLWQNEDGSVHMLLRSSEGWIYRSDSTDNGLNWCTAYPINIPNNNSGIDLTKAENGTIFLVCNPVGYNWGIRFPLTIFRSDNEGQTWKRILDLERGPGEFSYPATIIQNGKLIVTYTWKRKAIAFICVDLVDL